MSDWFNPPVPVTVAVQGVCAAPLKPTLAGQISVTVDGACACVILHAPFTGVMAKFDVPPITEGVTVPEPTPGPTEAGALVQLRPTV